MWYISFLFQLISVGSNYNYGSEDQAEFLCVVSRDVSDSQEQGAGGTEQSDKAKVMKEVMREVMILWMKLNIIQNFLCCMK